MSVTKSRQTLEDGTSIVVPPKTRAGRRIVAVPPSILPDLAAHIENYVAAAPDALLFTGERGVPLNRHRWGRTWREARTRVGLGHLRFHDLRHTGNTLAAATGASTKELMGRMGHASPRAALIYQHRTEDRDAAIARAMGKLIAPGEAHRPGGPATVTAIEEDP